MIIRKFLNNNNGFTLVEVLVSITILGIVMTSFLSFFNQAYSYTKKNEDKTVGINVARNVLYYLEQQDYKSFKDYYFPEPNAPEKVDLTIETCDDAVFDSNVCNGFFSTKINNVDYESTVTLTRAVKDNHGREITGLREYLIGVEVTVKWKDQTATVSGVIRK